MKRYEYWRELLGRRPRLLIAEDDHDVRSALVELFEKNGYDVRDVASGSALLHRLEPVLLSEPGHWCPEAIITDVKMPGLDAVDIVEELREVGWDIPIVVITGFGNSSLRQRIEAMCETEYFEKPLEFEELESRVRHVICKNCR
jgi:DNA-binding response OmpR family regulator